MKRWRLILGVVGVVAVTAAGFAWLMSPRPGQLITERNIKRIHEGMTQAQVEGILGAPPGNYTRGGIFSGFLFGLDPALRGEQWIGEDFGACVFFDTSGKVSVVAAAPTWLPDRERKKPPVKGASDSTTPERR